MTDSQKKIEVGKLHAKLAAAESTNHELNMRIQEYESYVTRAERERDIAKADAKAAESIRDVAIAECDELRRQLDELHRQR